MSTVKLRGRNAIVAVAILLAVGGARTVLSTAAVDEKAAEPIREWLRSELGGELGQDLDGLDASTISAARAQSLVEQSSAIDQLEIVDLKGRRAGKDRMIVRAEFRPGPNAAVETIYLQMRTRTVGRWEVRRETGLWKWRTSVLGGF